jgi:hypothetical protein
MFEGNRDFPPAEGRKADFFGEIEARRCYRIYKTILEIMEYRRYAVNDDSKNQQFP